MDLQLDMLHAAMNPLEFFLILINPEQFCPIQAHIFTSAPGVRPERGHSTFAQEKHRNS